MSNQQSFPCPDCSTSIFFEPRMLLQGAKFTCPNCKAVIGLAAESRDTVKESLDKLEQLKSEILKAKEENTQL